jgi:pyruvate dehydrogenase E2 component (dihydrolipoamide acetyltransferase)
MPFEGRCRHRQTFRYAAVVYEIVVPKLGVSVNEGTIIQWLKHEGETVRVGEPIFVVETEKTTVDIEANVSGTLLKIIHPEGVTLQAGRVVGLLAQPDEKPSTEVIEAKLREIIAREAIQQPLREPVTPASTQKEASAELAATGQRPIRASPAARQLMRDYGIDPATITGTGPAATITIRDVKLAAQKIGPVESELRVTSSTELSGTRLTIARKLTQINTEAVHVTLMADVDVTSLFEVKSKHPIGQLTPTVTELLVQVVARTLRSHPEINAIFEGNRIKFIDNINVGVAVDTPNGLKVPVLKDADRLRLNQITEKVRSLSEKARTGKISLQDMSGGTFTITNLGMFGVEGFTPILNPPQCAILGVGVVQEKPAVLNGQITVRKMMTLSLSFDHRVIDGVTAARFLNALKSTISNGNYENL